MSYLIDEGKNAEHLLMGNEAIVRGALELSLIHISEPTRPY